MKLRDKISWLMGKVQKSLIPHLIECVTTPLTEQEERLVTILEVVEVERHVSKTISRFRYPGRKNLDCQALARAFVAKSSTGMQQPVICVVLSAVNLRRYAGLLRQTASHSSRHFGANNVMVKGHAKVSLHLTIR